MARWAVTGGTGYIGNQLARALREQGHEVRTLGLREQATVRGDIRDRAAVEELVRDADVVVHLAAYVHKRASSASQQHECREINVAGTRTVVDSIAARARSALLINISTANVYAVAEQPIDESGPLAPRTVYGATKLEAEQIVRAAPFPAVTLRPAMIVGPGAPGNLPRLVRFVQRGVVLLLGDGQNQKTMAPVSRLVAAVMAIAAHRDRVAGETFNVGGGTFTMREILSIIADELAVRPRIVSLPAAPLRAAARVVDRLTHRSPLPSLAQMVETYASYSVFTDRKLEQLTGLGDDGDPAGTLRSAVRAISASR